MLSRSTSHFGSLLARKSHIFLKPASSRLKSFGYAKRNFAYFGDFNEGLGPRFNMKNLSPKKAMGELKDLPESIPKSCIGKTVNKREVEAQKSQKSSFSKNQKDFGRGKRSYYGSIITEGLGPSFQDLRFSAKTKNPKRMVGDFSDLPENTPSKKPDLSQNEAKKVEKSKTKKLDQKDIGKRFYMEMHYGGKKHIIQDGKSTNIKSSLFNKKMAGNLKDLPETKLSEK